MIQVWTSFICLMKKTKHSFISAHLRILFQNVVRHSNRSKARIVFDNILSTLPRRRGRRVRDERNSVGIALGRESNDTVSSLDFKLGAVVDAVAKDVNFGLSANEIAHVCAEDRMAALAFATSRNGYARQMGLSHIDGFGPQIGLSIVILRLNDWVPEVRSEAIKTVARLIENDGGPNGGLAFEIACSLGLLLDEGRFRRVLENEKHATRSLIEYPGVKAALHRVMLNGRTDRATSQDLEMIIKTGFCDYMIPEIAKHAKCSHRRLIAVRAILRPASVFKNEELSSMRKIYMEGFRDEVVRSALLDSSTSIAFAALGYLIQSDDLSALDDMTIGQLSTRKEASLTPRITTVLGMIRERI